MKTSTYAYKTLAAAGAPMGIKDLDKINEADTSLFPPNFGENTTDFHTSKDEGRLHHAELANLAAMARSILHQVGPSEVAHSELTDLAAVARSILHDLGGNMVIGHDANSERATLTDPAADLKALTPAQMDELHGKQPERPDNVTLTTLVSFNGGDGSLPESGLIADNHGDLFGTTSQGGAYGLGTVFEIAKTAHGYASTPTTLVSFNGDADGAYPYSGLIADNHGDLFGTTSQGGGVTRSARCSRSPRPPKATPAPPPPCPPT
jgi:uncharacterized repeat protein (TIGR03803 family)